MSKLPKKQSDVQSLRNTKENIEEIQLQKCLAQCDAYTKSRSKPSQVWTGSEISEVSLDPFYHYILEHSNFTSIDTAAETTKGHINDFKPVKLRYHNEEAYISTYSPLVLAEVHASLKELVHRSKNQTQSNHDRSIAYLKCLSFLEYKNNADLIEINMTFSNENNLGNSSSSSSSSSSTSDNKSAEFSKDDLVLLIEGTYNSGTYAHAKEKNKIK